MVTHLPKRSGKLMVSNFLTRHAGYFKAVLVFVAVYWLFIVRQDIFFVLVWDDLWFVTCMALLCLLVFLLAKKWRLMAAIGNIALWALVFLVNIKLLQHVGNFWLLGQYDYAAFFNVALSSLGLYGLGWLFKKSRDDFIACASHGLVASLLMYVMLVSHFSSTAVGEVGVSCP